MSRTDAVEALYQDMAARHRSRFRSIHVRASTPRPPSRRIPIPDANSTPGPPRRRAREGRRRQASLHQAASHQEPLLPPPPPRQQDQQPEALQRQAPHHVCVNKSLSFSGFFVAGKVGQVLQVFTRSHGTTTCICSLEQRAQRINQELTHELLPLL